MNPSLRRQCGLTLVELMVAITLSTMLLAGVLLLFSANKTTYRMQTGLSTLQENGRYALRQITEDLKIAGYGGCLSPHFSPSTYGAGLITMTAQNPDAYVISYSEGNLVHGDDDVGASPFQNMVVDAPAEQPNRDAIADTDWLEIRMPFARRVMYVAGSVSPESGTLGAANNGIGILGTETPAIADGKFFLIGDCAGGEIFEASGVAPLVFDNAFNKNSGRLQRAFSSEATVVQLSRRIYFVADTGRDNSSGQDILALYRHDPHTDSTQELVDGVEDLQITYQLDVNDDGVIDLIDQTAAEVEAADAWAQVTSVRVSLLMNSVEASSSTVAPYTFGESVSIVPPADDLRLRQEFTALVSIRNSAL